VPDIEVWYTLPYVELWLTELLNVGVLLFDGLPSGNETESNVTVSVVPGEAGFQRPPLTLLPALWPS